MGINKGSVGRGTIGEGEDEVGIEVAAAGCKLRGSTPCAVEIDGGRMRRMQQSPSPYSLSGVCVSKTAGAIALLLCCCPGRYCRGKEEATSVPRGVQRSHGKSVQTERLFAWQLSSKWSSKRLTATQAIRNRCTASSLAVDPWRGLAETSRSAVAWSAVAL